MFHSVHSVMIHVSDIPAAVEWYGKVLGRGPAYLLPNFPVFMVGDVMICFHQADEKVQSGTAGVVTYWQVDRLPDAIAHATSLGGKVHRGPLKIEGGQAICQILDPFGNLFGMVGEA